MLTVSDKNRYTAVFGPFCTTNSAFSFSQPVLGCIRLHIWYALHCYRQKPTFCNQFCASFARRCSEKLLYMLFPTCSKSQHFGTKNSALDFLGNLYMAALYFWLQSLLFPCSKCQRKTAVYLCLVPFWYQKQCIFLFRNLYLAAWDYLVCTSFPKVKNYCLQLVSWLHGTIWCALQCHKWKPTASNQVCVSLARRCSEKEKVLYMLFRTCSTFSHLQQICIILVPKTALWTFWQTVNA